MPRVSVCCLRAALLYLGTGFTLGAIMLAAPALDLPASILRLRPLHAEILLIGWTVQLAFGVAYWILPRFRAGPPRGSELAAWVSVLLLNAGVLAAGLGRTFGVPALPLAGRGAEMLAALIFAGHLWSRVGGLAGPPQVRSP